MISEQDFNLVAPWLKMKQEGVLNIFHSVNNAYSDGYGQERFVYIPGTRKDRVLIVAHSDTVFDDLPISLVLKDNKIIESANKNQKFELNHGNYTQTKHGVGINADDRAGCAIAWELRNLGHSILITSGEERGCICAKMLGEDSWWSKELNDKHQFALEFDRKNSKDLVFYDIASTEFVEYTVDITKYNPDSGGGGTDIKHICKSISGVNLSVGYSNPHDADEKLNLEDFLKTLNVAKEWLSKENLKRYDLNIKNKFSYYSSKYHKSYSSSYTGTSYYCSGSTINSPLNNNTSPAYDDSINCAHCNRIISYEVWFDRMFQCPNCGKET